MLTHCAQGEIKYARIFFLPLHRRVSLYGRPIEFYALPFSSLGLAFLSQTAGVSILPTVASGCASGAILLMAGVAHLLPRDNINGDIPLSVVHPQELVSQVGFLNPSHHFNPLGKLREAASYPIRRHFEKVFNGSDLVCFRLVRFHDAPLLLFPPQPQPPRPKRADSDPCPDDAPARRVDAA